jgi:hypothetical protein
MGGLGDLRDRIRDMILDEASDPTETVGWATTVAVYTAKEGSVTSYHTTRGKRCRSAAKILQVSGRSRTENEGTTEIRLEDFVCLERGEQLVSPPFFVATPRTSVPVHLTSQTRMVDDAEGSGIRIKVFSWTASGDPAPRVSFNWHCCVQVEEDTFSSIE